MEKKKSELEIGKIKIYPKFKRAVYPGTFDPPTNGHIDVAKRAASLFDELIIAISDNPSKHPMFSVEERKKMLTGLVANEKNIIIRSFTGLLVDYMVKENAIAIVRGLRAISDFEYELQMASMNSLLNNSIETVFFMSSDENLFVSSSVIKEIAMLGGDISKKVDPLVMKMIKDKFALMNQGGKNVSI